MKEIFVPKTNSEKRRLELVAVFKRDYLPLIENGDLCKSRAYEALAERFYLTRQGVCKMLKNAGVIPQKAV